MVSINASIIGIMARYDHIIRFRFSNFLFKYIRAIMPIHSPIRKNVMIRFIFSADILKNLLTSKSTGLSDIIKKEKMKREK